MHKESLYAQIYALSPLYLCCHCHFFAEEGAESEMMSLIHASSTCSLLLIWRAVGGKRTISEVVFETFPPDFIALGWGFRISSRGSK